MMDTPPRLVPNVTTVDVVLSSSRDEAPWRAMVASVLDAGLVLSRSSADQIPSLVEGTEVVIIASSGAQACQARGVVAGCSSAGVALELDGRWGPVERRGFPRAMACVPMRYRALDDKNAKQVATAIRSRITDRPASRVSDMPYDRNETAVLHARLRKIERALELLTDLVLWAGTSQSPMMEREVVLSASGISFQPDAADQLTEGAPIEVELLLPLRDPVRIRALGNVVRIVQDGGPVGRAAVKFDTIDESDRDEVSRYVFQLQRRRQASKLI